MDLPFAVSDPPPPLQPTGVLHHDVSSTALSSNNQQLSKNPALTTTIQSLPQQNGGLLYNNLIPGHYRYGTKPPLPPPGPLSVSSTEQQSQKLSLQNTNNSYSNVPDQQSSSHQSQNKTVLQVSEPEDDDDLYVIDLEEEDDDEKLYRPFRYNSSNGSVHTKSADRSASSSSSSSHGKSRSKVKNKTKPVETKPIDLLAVLLNTTPGEENPNNKLNNDVSILIEEATLKSRKARSMTTALAAKNDIQTSEKKDHDLYVETANAHAEAAFAFQRVYRCLLGITTDNNGKNTPSTDHPSLGLGPSEELAKSMLILANGHVKMASSLRDMGIQWNMGKASSFIVRSSQSKPEVASSSTGNNSTATTNEKKHTMAQHERIRLAVRGALDTANHEADITNSTFLARSTFMSNANNKQPNHADKSNVGGKGENHRQGCNKDNPIDDLMKLEKELKGMDMALEVGASVSHLGAAVSSRPDGSFCVVPPTNNAGSSYMSSSFMWSSGILGKVGGAGNSNQQQQNKQGNGLKSPVAGVRSRANHLQNFLTGGGNKPSENTHQATPSPAPVMAPTQDSSAKINQNANNNNTGLDQSWWGGGGQGSMMASVALSTVTASHQKVPTQQPVTNQVSSRQGESANTKQLMQLMDSLKRLGDENAQLMREVEEAKAARSEAVAAKNMMEQFKKEYSQRFLKVKEALEKYPRNNADNPVNNSAYIKSASISELQKRDQMIKTLAADLRKEREDSKKKDAALRKYEGFYKEVKARSAEKARQRKLEESKKKIQQQQG